MPSPTTVPMVIGRATAVEKFIRGGGSIRDASDFNRLPPAGNRNGCNQGMLNGSCEYVYAIRPDKPFKWLAQGQ